MPFGIVKEEKSVDPAELDTIIEAGIQKQKEAKKREKIVLVHSNPEIKIRLEVLREHMSRLKMNGKTGILADIDKILEML